MSYLTETLFASAFKGINWVFPFVLLNSFCLANSPAENKISFVFTQIGYDFAELKIDFPDVIHNLSIQKGVNSENLKPFKNFIGNHSEILLIDHINSFHEENVCYKLSYTDQNNEDYSIIYSCDIDQPVLRPILENNFLFLRAAQTNKNETLSILIYDVNDKILFQNDQINLASFSFPLINKNNITWFILYEFNDKRGVLKI